MNDKIKFEYRDVDLLVPYARNARVHTEEHVAELAGSIREFGFNVPVLIDEDNNIMAGHGRVLAARKLGMEKVPVVIASHLSDIQRRAFILADNKLHDNSSFDFELLNLELQDLKSGGFDLDLIGFDEIEVLQATEDVDPEGFDSDEFKDFVKDEDEFLAKKRVIIVYSDEEEGFVKALLGVAPDEKLIVVYDASDLAAKAEGDGDA